MFEGELSTSTLSTFHLQIFYNHHSKDVQTIFAGDIFRHVGVNLKEQVGHYDY